MVPDHLRNLTIEILQENSPKVPTGSKHLPSVQALPATPPHSQNSLIQPGSPLPLINLSTEGGGRGDVAFVPKTYFSLRLFSPWSPPSFFEHCLATCHPWWAYPNHEKNKKWGLLGKHAHTHRRTESRAPSFFLSTMYITELLQPRTLLS